MQLSDFDFSLPEHLIAQHPTKQRTQSRLLIAGTPIEDKKFINIIDYLKPNDLLVLNNTKVMPARLYANKETGAKVEIMINRILSDTQALVMMKSSKSPKIGSKILLDNQYHATVLAKYDYLYNLEFSSSIQVILDNLGHIPLPPYIERADDLADKTRYQTVFAKKLGAVAAPTAGLHFDQTLLDQLQQKGIDNTEVTLHVGAGTFLPVKTDDITQHKMHSEFIEVSEEVIEKIKQTKQKNGRIIAVGTTAVRALESCALTANSWQDLTPCTQETNIFIYPGFEFKVVDLLITNFHLPKSSLLMLVSAFTGSKTIKQIYQHAIKQQYRFFSYGDAMLLKNQRQLP